MATWKNEEEAREQIKALVTEYYHDFKENKKTGLFPVFFDVAVFR